MSLFKSIKASQLQARKDKDVVKTNLLTTVIGEVQNKFTSIPSDKRPEEPSDDMVESLLKTFRDKAEETLTLREDEKVKQELVIILSFLPTPLTQEELKEVVENVLMGFVESQHGNKIGYVMNQLKGLYKPSQYDAKLVRSFIG